MKTVISKLTGLIALLLFTLLLACSDESKDNAYLEIRLVDEPASYDEVNVEVLGVSVNYGGEGEETGWQELETNGGTYNLLDLTAGNDVLLVGNDVPAGTISEVRLLLGENNSVVEGGDTYPLKTPSGQSSGYKIKIQQSFEGGIDYTIVLDFDVAKSVKANPQKYILQPVVRASLEALNGAIKGTVTPTTESSFIYAIQGQDTIASTTPDEAGAFMFRGMEAGAYNVSFDVSDDSTEVEDQLVESVAVEIGVVTDMGEVDLSIQE